MKNTEFFNLIIIGLRAMEHILRNKVYSYESIRGFVPTLSSHAEFESALLRPSGFVIFEKIL
jgi:hypothetical protein